MRKTILFICFVCAGLAALSQGNGTTSSTKYTGRTAFYAELGGPGILFSANIDSRFARSTLGWGFRAGLGFISGYLEPNNQGWYDDPSSVVSVPVQVNYIFGKTNTPHTFEVGGGITFTGRKIEVLDFYQEPVNFFGTASFMYRRQPANGGFTWRIGFTPLIAKGYVQAFGGASVGYSF